MGKAIGDVNSVHIDICVFVVGGTYRDTHVMHKRQPFV